MPFDIILAIDKFALKHAKKLLLAIMLTI